MKTVAELTLAPILSEGIGYGILFGVGLVMAIVVTLLVRAESKWLGTKKTFEWFYAAGRNVKSGLIAASVVSSWTWTAYPSSIIKCCLPIWHKWTVLVCCRRKHSDTIVCDISNRTEKKSAFVSHFSRNNLSSF